MIEELIEALTDDERNRIKIQMSIADARPNDLDGTLEAWLVRIGLWGKIKITRKDPENKINKEINKDEFLNYIDDYELNVIRGKWNVIEEKINVIKFVRNFWSINGREEKEELKIEIDLRDDLKKLLKKSRN